MSMDALALVVNVSMERFVIQRPPLSYLSAFKCLLLYFSFILFIGNESSLVPTV